jgi:hypothetical protein
VDVFELSFEGFEELGQVHAYELVVELVHAGVMLGDGVVADVEAAVGAAAETGLATDVSAGKGVVAEGQVGHRLPSGALSRTKKDRPWGGPFLFGLVLF